jgi:hypothetical protein
MFSLHGPKAYCKPKVDAPNHAGYAILVNRDQDSLEQLRVECRVGDPGQSFLATAERQPVEIYPGQLSPEGAPGGDHTFRLRLSDRGVIGINIGKVFQRCSTASPTPISHPWKL